jgi:hypothetical protein
MRINKLMTDLLVLWMTNDNKKRRKGVKPEIGPGFWYDIPYKGDQDDQHRFDLMLADPSKRLHRLFIDIHGGRLPLGNRKNNYTYAMLFVMPGTTFASRTMIWSKVTSRSRSNP